MSDMLTPRQAAQELGIHYETALRWIRDGKMPGVVSLADHVWQGRARRYYRIDAKVLAKWKRRKVG